MLHDSYIARATRYVATLSTPEAFCAAVGRAQGNFVLDRNFLRFPIPDDLILWFEPEANQSGLFFELQVFGESVAPHALPNTFTITRYVEASAPHEESWRELRNDESFPVELGRTSYCAPGVAAGLCLLEAPPASLYAITAYTPTE